MDAHRAVEKLQKLILAVDCSPAISYAMAVRSDALKEALAIVLESMREESSHG